MDQVIHHYTNSESNIDNVKKLNILAEELKKILGKTLIYMK